MGREERLSGKELWVVLSFPSYLSHHFSVSDWLIQGSIIKKGYKRVPWSFVFLRMLLPSFWSKQTNKQKKMACQIRFTYLVVDTTHLAHVHSEPY